MPPCGSTTSARCSSTTPRARATGSATCWSWCTRNRAPWQGDLFAHAIDRRHDRDNPVPGSLPLLRARAELMAVPVAQRRGLLDDPDRLRAAGMAWEALAGWLQGPMDAATWESIIPSMGVMALIRNLRNFDEADVSDEVAAGVAARISDPEQVARSRQLPYRWYSAYREVPSDRWAVALGTALECSTYTIPDLPGRTLVLVDTSASMSHMAFSARSTVRPVDAAALFAVALAYRCGPGRSPVRVGVHLDAHPHLAGGGRRHGRGCGTPPPPGPVGDPGSGCHGDPQPAEALLVLVLVHLGQPRDAPHQCAGPPGRCDQRVWCVGCTCAASAPQLVILGSASSSRTVSGTHGRASNPPQRAPGHTAAASPRDRHGRAPHRDGRATFATAAGTTAW
jgi:TROVE domain.